MKHGTGLKMPGYLAILKINGDTRRLFYLFKRIHCPFKPGYTIYSDANDAIYFFTGRQGKFLPHKEDSPGKKSFLNDRHCYVVWFNDGENTDLVNRDFILNIKKMKLLKQFNDGAIYGPDE